MQIERAVYYYIPKLFGQTRLCKQCRPRSTPPKEQFDLGLHCLPYLHPTFR